ncbi:hypothetical protein AAMO2058_000195200 [Amorphochlora amoebiformis]|mmetsp:Transcript_26099/g.41304  ORF Transcript_26099/g.41304 Transcript_26099/m.41304 type:complete len:314 (-) Transcript_26099:77-1018(-)
MGLKGKITPKRQATRRALKDREPKIVENVKKAFFIKGPKTSQVVNFALKDLYMLKKPNGKILNKKNQVRPFEDHSSLEFLSKQMDHSLFCLGTLTKKKGHCLTFGRMFNHQLLDMVEVSINVDGEFKRLSEFSGDRKKSVLFGSKPMFVFQGDEFEVSENHKTIKSLILDFFRGEIVEKIHRSSIDRVVVVSATNSRIYFRHYAVQHKRSGDNVPKVRLDEVGPRMNWQLRRVKTADTEVRKVAMRQPKARKSQAKMKNKEKDKILGEMGRIHMQRQDTKTMALRKFKSLQKRRREENDGEGSKRQKVQEGDE